MTNDNASLAAQLLLISLPIVQTLIQQPKISPANHLSLPSRTFLRFRHFRPVSKMRVPCHCGIPAMSFVKPRRSASANDSADRPTDRRTHRPTGPRIVRSTTVRPWRVRPRLGSPSVRPLPWLWADTWKDIHYFRRPPHPLFFPGDMFSISPINAFFFVLRF